MAGSQHLAEKDTQVTFYRLRCCSLGLESFTVGAGRHREQ